MNRLIITYFLPFIHDSKIKSIDVIKTKYFLYQLSSHSILRYIGLYQFNLPFT